MHHKAKTIADLIQEERWTEAHTTVAASSRADISELATGECGKGRAWPRGLVADAHLRGSVSLLPLGNEEVSLSGFDQHLDPRGPACRSIYRLGELAIHDLRSFQRQSSRKHSRHHP